MQEEAFTLQSSPKWSDHPWFLDQKNRQYEETKWKVYSKGSVTGPLYGGNLCTLNLLQGTGYMPELKDCILFIEDDSMTCPETFARDFTSLLQTSEGVKGLLLGRFQKSSGVTEEQLRFILDKHPQLKEIPVLYDMDFGHTQPILTLPIGGTVQINTQDLDVRLIDF